MKRFLLWGTLCLAFVFVLILAFFQNMVFAAALTAPSLGVMDWVDLGYKVLEVLGTISLVFYPAAYPYIKRILTTKNQLINVVDKLNTDNDIIHKIAESTGNKRAAREIKKKLLNSSIEG